MYIENVGDSEIIVADFSTSGRHLIENTDPVYHLDVNHFVIMMKLKCCRSFIVHGSLQAG